MIAVSECTPKNAINNSGQSIHPVTPDFSPVNMESQDEGGSPNSGNV